MIFLISSEGLQVDSDEVSPILRFPAPVNISKVRQFLGLASWYRRFISDFATIAAPLTLLLRKNQSWVWGEEQQDVFEKIRFLSTTNPVLARYDYSKEVQLQTDASSTELGAVLSQNIDGVERVIAYTSRSQPWRSGTTRPQNASALPSYGAYKNFVATLRVPTSG